MTQPLRIVVNNKTYLVEIANPTASPLTVSVNGQPYTVFVDQPSSDGGRANSSPPAVASMGSHPPANAAPPADPKQVSAPMPGTILEIKAKPGDKVSYGQPLCVLEAMKMKIAIRSPRDGVVFKIHVAEKQSVAYGESLVTFE